MPETEAPRDLAIDSSKHGFYERIKKGEYIPELKGYEMAYLFAIAMAYGVHYKKRKPLRPGHIKRSISRNMIDKEFSWLIRAIAISALDEGVDIIPDRTQIYKIAEEYANGGIEIIEEEITNIKQFELDMELELNKIMGEIASKTEKTDKIQTIPIQPKHELESMLDAFEVRIRKFIDSKLTENKADYWSDINLDFKKDIDQRIRDYLVKNPSLNSEDIKPLEFFTMGEYYKIMKFYWMVFESIFRSKTELEKHFRNINELRNCFKHVREPTITEKKLGEASLIWFETILNK
ncbi:MAG: hypothetical protein ABSD81_09195 [Methanomicrobiales archaeon]|jgi:hypothetical protein